MANPRKFSEKIALHNQKQAEETAEFEKIMREVQGVQGKDGQIAIQEEGGIKKSRSAEIYKRISSSNSPRESRSPSRQAGGPIRHKRIEYGTSPYQSTNMSYLTPPDLNWRRSSSDSAIHTSLNQHLESTDLMQPHTHPAMHRTVTTVDSSNQSLNKSQPIPIQLNAGSATLIDIRSRSASTNTRSPYLSSNAQPTDFLLNAKNTGSLPDLTSFHLLLPTNSSNMQHSPPGNMYEQQHPSQTTTPQHHQQYNNSCTYDATYDNSKNQVLDFQMLQMLNNPNDVVNASSFNIKTEANNGFDIDVSKHYSSTELTNNFILSQSIEPSSIRYGSANKLMQDSSLKDYRMPPTRPSPGSSPNLSIKFANQYDINNSAPCSPIGQVAKQENFYEDMENYYENSIKDLAQFSLEDTSPTRMFSDCLNSVSIHDPGESNSSGKQLQSDILIPGIPEIVLTDYSSSIDFKDILGDSLELGQMDIVGLQMLSDPDMIADSFTEDSLRKDLNLH